MHPFFTTCKTKVRALFNLRTRQYYAHARLTRAHVLTRHTLTKHVHTHAYAKHARTSACTLTYAHSPKPNPRCARHRIMTKTGRKARPKSKSKPKPTLKPKPTRPRFIPYSRTWHTKCAYTPAIVQAYASAPAQDPQTRLMQYKRADTRAYVQSHTHAHSLSRRH